MVVFTADFTLDKSSLQRLCGVALQWDVVQMTVVLVNMLAKSAPYRRLLPPLWYLSVGIKAAAFACMLMYPRRCSLLSVACPLAESQRRKRWFSVSLQGVLSQVHRVDLPWFCLTMHLLQLCTSAIWLSHRLCPAHCWESSSQPLEAQRDATRHHVDGDTSQSRAGTCSRHSRQQAAVQTAGHRADLEPTAGHHTCAGGHGGGRRCWPASWQ